MLCQPRQINILTFDTSHVYVKTSAMIYYLQEIKKFQTSELGVPNIYWALAKVSGIVVGTALK